MQFGIIHELSGKIIYYCRIEMCPKHFLLNTEIQTMKKGLFVGSTLENKFFKNAKSFVNIFDMFSYFAVVLSVH